MIINTEQLTELLESDIPPYAISNYMGINNSIVDNLMHKRSKLSETKLKTLLKLQAFYNENGTARLEIKKIKGLKGAVGAYNKWQGSARLYYHRVENWVACYTYNSPENHETFADENVVEVLHKSTRNMLERDTATTMLKLSKLCQETL